MKKFDLIIYIRLEFVRPCKVEVGPTLEVKSWTDLDQDQILNKQKIQGVQIKLGVTLKEHYSITKRLAKNVKTVLES